MPLPNFRQLKQLLSDVLGPDPLSYTLPHAFTSASNAVMCLFSLKLAVGGITCTKSTRNGSEITKLYNYFMYRKRIETVE